MLPAIERAGLWVTDLEVLRLHYAKTLRHWRARFAGRRPEIVKLYDERLARMLEFYLAVSDISVRWGGHMVWRLQLSKRVDAPPLTRTYMLDPREIGSGEAGPPRRNRSPSRRSSARPADPRRRWTEEPFACPCQPLAASHRTRANNEVCHRTDPDLSFSR